MAARRSAEISRVIRRVVWETLPAAPLLAAVRARPEAEGVWVTLPVAPLLAPVRVRPEAEGVWVIFFAGGRVRGVRMAVLRWASG